MASAIFKFYVRRDFGAVFTVSSESYSGSGGIGENQSIKNLCKSFFEESVKIENNVICELRGTLSSFFIAQYFLIYLQKAIRREKRNFQRGGLAIKIYRRQAVSLMIVEFTPKIFHSIMKWSYNVLISSRKKCKEIELTEDQVEYLHGNAKNSSFLAKH